VRPLGAGVWQGVRASSVAIIGRAAGEGR